jgi:hypothetical protein
VLQDLRFSQPFEPQRDEFPRIVIERLPKDYPSAMQRSGESATVSLVRTTTTGAFPAFCVHQHTCIPSKANR